MCMLCSIVMQAMSDLSHLDGKLNALSLGFVHSGNIFISGSSCRLGGLENALLGYRSRQYSLLEDYKTQLDVLMFGNDIDSSFTCEQSDICGYTAL